MAQCYKPGDLAVITHDTPGCTANVGRIVEILGRSDAGVYGDRPAWCIAPVTDDLYVVEYDRGGEAHFRFMNRGERGVAHPGDWMMPVSLEYLSGANGTERRSSP